MQNVQTPGEPRPLTGGHENPERDAQLRDLATVDAMLDCVQRIADAYQSHCDGLAVKLPEREPLDRAVDIIVGAVEAARKAHVDLFDSVSEAGR